jgi:hypothetical protein
MTDILDLIDSAVSDWETSDDAMRYNPKPPTTRVVTGGGTVRFGDGPVIPVINMELVMRPLVSQFSMVAESFRLFNERMSVDLSVAFAQFARALGIVPRHGSPGAPPCACHPAPFPAARDYRRRTKHRNRRR